MRRLGLAATEGWRPSSASTDAGELGNTAGGMFTDSLQHIHEVGVGVDTVQSTGDDQSLDDANVLGAEFSPAKEPGVRPIGTTRSARSG